MRKLTVLVVLVTLGLAGTALAGWPENVKQIAVEKGKSVTVAGKLEDGKPMADLDWAAKSSVACFPGTQNEKFRGPHVLFATSLPPKSVLTITVTPDDPNGDLSLYAYEIGANNFSLPPALASCVSCEAEHKWDRPKKGKTQTAARSVKLNAIRNPYNVVIGVSGPASAKGGFKLELDLQ